MKKLLKSKKFYRKLLIVSAIIYIAYVFASQQRVLDSYRAAERYYLQQVDVKTAYRNSLTETRANIDSKEYIEDMAREKLDMFLPNERIYVNVIR
ncbi:MAG: septum formation initiator family protein [Oscillospiraceae bacterium]|nr:septum formation initiator family protein [Oscillospiraceae bacterium]